MLGGHDDNAHDTSAAQPATQDETLNGVADLVGGSVTPDSSNSPYSNDDFYTSAPQAPAQQTNFDQPHDNTPDPVSSVDKANNDDLLDIKQKALQQLSPLVSQLDQSPQEKFRTIMMLIQASDNQSLLQGAYDAAQQIADEKARAQALLDVINEINYFTQKHDEPNS